MKKLVSFLALFLLITSLQAEEAIIEGVVLKAETNEPVTNQTVNFFNYETQDSLFTQTDETGTFQFSINVLPADSILIEISTTDPCTGERLNEFIYNPWQENLFVFMVCNNTPPIECQAVFDYYFDNPNDSMIYTDPLNNLGHVQFIDQSVGTINSWQWDFGDGTSSTQQNPMHYYELPGVYNVSLTITTSNCESTIENVVEVNPYNPDCQAQFEYFTITADTAYYEDSANTNGLTIQFAEYSFGEVSNYYWDFGDGTTSNEQNPAHTYDSAGAYYVTFSISSAICEDSITQQVMVYPNNIHCKAMFDYSFYSYSDSTNFEDSTENLTAYFYNYSQGNVHTSYWDFGDGTISYDYNPVHTYEQPGIYNVSLTIYTNNCENTFSMEVWAGNIVQDCEAFFAYDYMNWSDSMFSDPPTEQQNTIYFYDYSYGDIISRLWNFGDGHTSTQTNPSHTYESAGEYMVSLEITTPDCQSYYETYVWVADNDTIWNPDDCLAMFFPEYNGNKTVHFMNESYGNIESYFWDFGDGSTSTEENPIHTYSENGEHLISLNTITYDSCFSTFETYIFINNEEYNNEITAFFIPEINGNTVKFRNQSSGDIWNYYWDFGDETNSDAKSPQHKYAETQTYTVTLGVGNGEAVSTYTMQIDLATGKFKGFYGDNALSLNKKLPKGKAEVYPNPFKSNLSITLPKTEIENLNIEITNVSGKVVYSKSIKNNQTTINTGGFDQGVYFLSIYKNHVRTETIKIIK